MFYRRRGKRLLDIVLSSTALLLLAPVLLTIFVLLRWRLPGEAIFRQDRAGLDGQVFRLWKFRTMTNARDQAGHLLPDAERLTRLGIWLRSTSLDELPELWNILRGDMSMVGPRPLLVEYLPRYSKQQARRHEVLPGLTGLAQVSGRNACDWTNRFEKDVQYVDNVSFRNDCWILFQTVRCVLDRQGVSAAGHATMPPFMGDVEEASRAA